MFPVRTAGAETTGPRRGRQGGGRGGRAGAAPAGGRGPAWQVKRRGGGGGGQGGSRVYELTLYAEKVSLRGALCSSCSAALLGAWKSVSEEMEKTLLTAADVVNGPLWQQHNFLDLGLRKKNAGGRLEHLGNHSSCTS